MKNAALFKSLERNLFKFPLRYFSANVKIEQKTDYLRIIKDAKTFDFHYFWLRHNCGCEQGCKHPYSKERIINIPDVPLDIKPKNVTLTSNETNNNDNNSTVTIDWGNHKTSYDLSFLLNNSYSKNRKEPTLPHYNLNDIIIDYSKEKNNLKTYRKKCYDTLTLYGLIVVKNRGLDTEEIIEELGGKIWESHFGRYEDLKTNNTTNKNNDQLGYTNSAVELHTDQPFVTNPPGMQMLQCLQAASVGGENYLANAVNVADYLRAIDPVAFHILTTTPVVFHRKQKNFESKLISPILQLDESSTEPVVKQVRFSYFTYAPFNYDFYFMRKWYESYQLFNDLVNKYSYQVALAPGDYVLYNNYTMLHARNGFSGDRHMRGVYFDIDTVVNSLKDD